MAKSELRIQAIALRRKGTSVGDIARTLNVSKGTASIWCKDVQLTEEQQNLLKQAHIAAGSKGRLIGAEKNRQKRLKNVAFQSEIASQMVGTVTERDLMMLGIGLYWGEGVKANNSSTAIVNSDPAIVRLARDWFEMLGVTRDRFRPYIFISETHQARKSAIIAFWAEHLSLPVQQCNRVVFLKGRPKKIYENHDSYYGIVALRISRGTDLKYRILGLIEACKEKAGVAQW